MRGATLACSIFCAMNWAASLVSASHSPIALPVDMLLAFASRWNVSSTSERTGTVTRTIVASLADAGLRSDGNSCFMVMHSDAQPQHCQQARSNGQRLAKAAPREKGRRRLEGLDR